MIEQYREIKRTQPDAILFFRLGDFYEMFFEDAELAARELEITLTSREAGKNVRVPMCGVPYHAANNYIARLIAKGFSVAICEQVEDPKLAKGIVKRELIKVITPGTITAEALLPGAANNFLVVLREEAEGVGLAACDSSTGECLWTAMQAKEATNKVNEVCDFVYHLMPAEILVIGRYSGYDELAAFVENRISRCSLKTWPVEDFNAIDALPAEFFGEESIPDFAAAKLAVGCLLLYLKQTIRSDLSHISRLTHYRPQDFLAMDAATLRNLEISRNLRDGSSKNTLLSVVDYTKTAMGARTLRRWLEYPLVNPHQIEMRLEAVEELVAQLPLRKSISALLSNVYDLERILARVETGSSNGRDLVALKNSLKILPELKQALRSCHSRLLAEAASALKTHYEVVELIEAALLEQQPFSVKEGGMIKPGYDIELDELVNFSRDSQDWLTAYEAREREETGIRSLKVRYNRVFGYYIEVTNAHSDAVPSRYIRRQTLANAERFTTPELREFEVKILGAQEKIAALEWQLFQKVREFVRERLNDIQKTASLLAIIDVLVSFAEAASLNNYVRPQINARREIAILDGRHPVVEKYSKDLFVPNDVHLNHDNCEIMIITGPNMAGKSTYMRMVAHIILMAQAGCFVPAKQASIGPVDRIFTRIGASDDLTMGQSTFMVEMNEVSQILRFASRDSLIILDEIGRGTSTFDGISIAKAVIEYIKDRIGAKTMFATHFHELTVLEEYSPKIKNFAVAVKERGNEVVFLRRIIPGSADRSYGIHVAQLAGLPKRIIKRAQEILAHMEATGGTPAAMATPGNAPSRRGDGEVSLFSSSLPEKIMGIDIQSTTPLEALNILHQLQLQARREAGIG